MQKPKSWCRIYLLSILLISVVVLSSSGVLVGRAETVREANQASSISATTIYDHQQFLPIVFKNYPWISYLGVEVINSLSRATTLENTQSLDVGWVRMGYRVKWSELQPVEGGAIQWDLLADFEKELRALKDAGITPVVAIHSNPLWAVVTRLDDPTSVDENGDGIGDGKSYCGAIAQDKFDDFAMFMSQLVARYSTSEFGVRYWELGNEVDVDPRLVWADSVFGCWGNEYDLYYGGAHYGEMLKVVVPAMRQKDHNAKIWIGGLLLANDNTPISPPIIGRPEFFLEGVLRANATPYFDAVPYHWYAWYSDKNDDFDFDALGNSSWLEWGGGAYGKATFLKQMMARYGVSKPLVMNETALGCDPRWSDNCEPSLGDGFLQAQADFIVRAALRARQAGVIQTTYFMQEENTWGYVGLLDKIGHPKPVFYTYQNLNSQLKFSTYLGTISYGRGIEGYAFERGNNSLLHVVWTLQDEVRQIKIPESKLIAIYGRDGESIPLPTPVNGYYYPDVKFQARYFILNP